MPHSSDFHKGFCSIVSANLGDSVLPRASGCGSVPPGAVPAPLSNTGLNDQILETGIDYLTLIVPVAGPEVVTELIDKIANIYTDSYETSVGKPYFCGRSFANHAKSPCGALIIWNLPGENDDKGSMRIALSGEVLKRAHQMQSVRLISHVFSNGGKCKRIDLKADDYSRSIHPSTMYDAVQAGNYKGFRKGNITAEIGGNVYEDGWTIYLGSRESERFTRYYNAKPVHGIEAFRFEVEFKDELANQTAMHLTYCIDDEEMLTRMISANIAGNVTFIDKSNQSRAHRCEMLPWWKEFTDRLGSSIRLSVPKIVPTIQRSIDWIEHSVSATLAMVSQYYGIDKIEFIKQLIDRGTKKLTNRHQTILDTSPIAMRNCLNTN